MCNAYGYLANDVFIIITPVGGGTADAMSALQRSVWPKGTSSDDRSAIYKCVIMSDEKGL